MARLQLSKLKMDRLLVLLILAAVHTGSSSATLEYEFVTVDWDWDSDCVRQEFIESGQYVPENCIPSGIKVGEGGQIYVTVPRATAKEGVPSSLNTVHRKHGVDKGGVLRPYPDWETNKVGNCSGIQFAMSMDIDPRTGFMYVIDVGRVGIFTAAPANLCPAKILVLDTRNGGKVVSTHEFPDSVVSRSGNFLNDIVLDYVDPDHVTGVRYAYLSDLYMQQIVVYDFTTNTSWSFKDPRSMGIGNESLVTMNGQQYNLSLALNGIAISPTFNYVYYSTVSSKALWQVPTWVLRNKNANFSRYTRQVGIKKSNSDALIFGHRGLYYAALEDDAVYRWEIEKDLVQQGVLEGEVILRTETPLAQNWETIQWPDGLSFGNPDTENLYFFTTKVQLATTGKMDFTGKQGPNFRIFKIFVNDSSGYLPATISYAHMGLIG